MTRRDAATGRCWVVMDKPGVELHHMVFTFRAHEEDGQFVSYCEELGVPSSGATVDEALRNAIEATLLYLNTIEETRDRRRIFDERNIEFDRGLPPDPRVNVPGKRTVEVDENEIVTRRRLAQV